MKFFTPELLLRFASPDDKISLAAQEELENCSEQYLKHLQDVEAKLPERFSEMLGRFYLHDSRVLPSAFPMPPDFPFRIHWLDWLEPTRLDGGQEGRWPSLFIALQLDTPPKEVLVLHYRSVVIDEMSQYRPFQEERLPYLEWQHDEVDVVTENGVDYALHSILFSNGFEVRLQFSGFDFATMKPLPSPSQSDGDVQRK